MMRLTTVAFLLIILCSCAKRIKVPINRFETSESLGSGGEIELRQGTHSHGQLDLSDGDLDNPLEMGTSKGQGLGLTAALGESLDLMWRVPHEAPTIIGAKVQVLGSPEKSAGSGNTLSIAFGMGADRDTFDGEPSIKMKYDIQDYMILHGYRLTPNFTIYDGLSISTYEFEGELSSEDDEDLDGETLEYTAENIIGFWVGGMYTNHPIKAKFEIALQKIEWDYTESKMFYAFGYTFGMVF